MRCDSYQTRALVAHCVHASHGNRGRHAISSAARLKCTAINATKSHHKAKRFWGEMPVQPDSPRSIRGGAMVNLRLRNTKAARTPATTRGAPIDVHPNGMPARLN